MDGRPLVSIIIPCFNSAKYIKQAIDSVLLQSGVDKEIIIVDDFSTDSSWDITEEYVKKYPDQVKSFRNRVKGGNNARNLGFDQSNGDFIQWLDADDTLLPNKLKTQAEYLLYSRADIVYSGGYLITYDKDHRMVKTEDFIPRSTQDYLFELLRDKWLPSHAYLLTREIADTLYLANGWNPETSVAQDREYFTKAAIMGANFCYVPGLFCIYNRRINENSLSRSLHARTKSQVIVKLLNEFRAGISESQLFTPQQKANYDKIIYTLLLYYFFVFRIGKVPVNRSRFAIEWNLIKGTSSKLKVLVGLLSGNVIFKH